MLLNQIEELSVSLREARMLIQEQRDEINRLKGEQGKPDIKGSVTQPASNHSSEKERRTTREQHYRELMKSLHSGNYHK